MHQKLVKRATGLKVSLNLKLALSRMCNGAQDFLNNNNVKSSLASKIFSLLKGL